MEETSLFTRSVRLEGHLFACILKNTSHWNQTLDRRNDVLLAVSNSLDVIRIDFDIFHGLLHLLIIFLEFHTFCILKEPFAKGLSCFDMNLYFWTHHVLHSLDLLFNAFELCFGLIPCTSARFLVRSSFWETFNFLLGTEDVVCPNKWEKSLGRFLPETGRLLYFLHPSLDCLTKLRNLCYQFYTARLILSKRLFVTF